MSVFIALRVGLLGQMFALLPDLTVFGIQEDSGTEIGCAMNGSNYKGVLLDLPDPAICRARRVIKGVVDCLVEKAFLCPYALSYGHNILCTHPLAEQIVATTQSKRVVPQPAPPDPAPHKPAKLPLAA